MITSCILWPDEAKCQESRSRSPLQDQRPRIWIVSGPAWDRLLFDLGMTKAWYTKAKFSTLNLGMAYHLQLPHCTPKKQTVTGNKSLRSLCYFSVTKTYPGSVAPYLLSIKQRKTWVNVHSSRYVLNIIARNWDCSRYVVSIWITRLCAYNTKCVTSIQTVEEMYCETPYRTYNTTYVGTQ